MIEVQERWKQVLLVPESVMVLDPTPVVLAREEDVVDMHDHSRSQPRQDLEDLEHDVGVPDFNRYGSRRGNHEVMMRGTFANVRIKNLMLPVKADGSRVEGGVTLIQPDGGRQTADVIPGARFELIEGMGHDYPPQLWDRWVALVADHALH